jgi:hypothetical protein
MIQERKGPRTVVRPRAESKKSYKRVSLFYIQEAVSVKCRDCDHYMQLSTFGVKHLPFCRLSHEQHGPEDAVCEFFTANSKPRCARCGYFKRVTLKRGERLICSLHGTRVQPGVERRAKMIH